MLPRLNTKRTDDSDIDDDIAILAVARRAQKRLSDLTRNTSEQTQIETGEPQLPTVHDFIIT